MLHKYTPDQLGLKRRFAFVFLRWVGMLFVAFTPIPYALGRYGAFVLVIVYIALISACVIARRCVKSARPRLGPRGWRAVTPRRLLLIVCLG